MSHWTTFLTFCLVFATANSATVGELKAIKKIGSDEKLSGRIYYMSTFKATWQDALSYCVLTEGLNFLYLTSRQIGIELMQDVELHNLIVPNERIWIAGKESTNMNNRFFWHYNSQEREFVYTNWASGEPNTNCQNNNRVDCVDIKTSDKNQDGYTWKTNDCAVKQYFICVGV